MSHTFQKIEAVLLPTAIQYTPEGTQQKIDILTILISILTNQFLINTILKN